jgi:hypothetical protein
VAGGQQFYTVVDGDDCESIESEFDITLAQFSAWNPSVGSQCTNLWLEEAYCVKARPRAQLLAQVLRPLLRRH